MPTTTPHTHEDETVLGARALAGLRSLYREMLDPEHHNVGDFSAADECERLYELLGSLGMEVP